MKDLWTEWPKLKHKISVKKKKLLLLDFDGTLASIAKTPDEVRLSDTTKKILVYLSQLKDYQVVIISGRSLSNLKSFFHLRNIIYVGNHGLEISGDGLTPPARARKAKKLQFLIWTLLKKLSADFYYLPGIFVENKGVTISLHFRNLPKESEPPFIEVLKYFKRKYKDYPIIWRKGKKVWEIFPKVNWDKGQAALFLMKKYPNSFPIVIGDDRTDEDMFFTMKPFGITIRVGHSKKSIAKYYLKSQKDINVFLEKLCH